MIRTSLLAAIIALPASAQIKGDEQVLNCSALVQSDMVDSSIKVICGISSEQMVEMMRLAISKRPEDYSELLAKLEALTPREAQLKAESLRSFFHILQQDEVPPEHLRDRLVEIARRHISLKEELAAIEVADPNIQVRLDRVQQALDADPPQHDVASRELAEAEALRQRKFNSANALLKEQAREMARLMCYKANIEASLMDRLDSARLFEEAANLTPQEYSNQKWSDLRSAADMLFDQGLVTGDKVSLERALAILTDMTKSVPRVQAPLLWARTQSKLGDTLQLLGSLERGRRRLDEARTAYHHALEELTRDRVPLEWAQVQSNLGTVLHDLGELEEGTDRFNEAVAAFRLSLEEQVRDNDPLLWAWTHAMLGDALSSLGESQSGLHQMEAAITGYRIALEKDTCDPSRVRWNAYHGLGNALLTVGSQDSGSNRIAEAVASFRLALEERARDRDPLGWARAQASLASALHVLGQREDDTGRLKEAVAAYRLALEERTRDRVPLEWAWTQDGLAGVLHALGEREDDTGRLEEAVAAYRLALEERTRDRVPLDWARTQDGLAGVLHALGEREDDTGRLKEAVAAYRLALEERTRDRVPLDWAITSTSLAQVETTLFQRTSDQEWIVQAKKHAADARAVFVKNNSARYLEWSKEIVDQTDFLSKE
ncbi:hypothetical protein [Rhodobacter sp. NSM]|uniref:hypothetical protein n=1 Tax=Rhodobacter sp. NSM TaxID=3457501 RepID=UPI003FD22D4F